MARAFLENVDIIDTLQQIANYNNFSYQSDLEYDKRTLEESVYGSRDDKLFLWYSRRNGTWLVPERSVYIHNIEASNSWWYYGASNSENIKAYFVEVMEKHDGIIMGNIVEMDYAQHLNYLWANFVKPTDVEIVFKDPNGVRTFPIMEYDQNTNSIIQRYGRIDRKKYLVENEYELQRVIKDARDIILEEAEPQTVEEHIRQVEKSGFECYGYQLGDKTFLNHQDAIEAVKFRLAVFAIGEDGSEIPVESLDDFWVQVRHTGLFCVNREEKTFLKYLQNSDLPLFSEEENEILYESVLRAAKENKIENLAALNKILYKLEHLNPNLAADFSHEPVSVQEIERE